MVSKDIIKKILDDSISKCYTTYHYTNSNGKTVSLRVRSVKRPSTFVKYLHNARLTIPVNDRWRVLEPSMEQARVKYANSRMFITEHGSTIAIDENNTIISVCSYKDKKGKSVDSGGALMEYAVSLGGDKLDTFDGNYTFYTHMGFTPVSWIRFEDFDKNYIPEWVNGNKNNPNLFREEDIVFFKYTGVRDSESKSDFYNRVAPITTGDDVYNTASRIRDNYKVD